MRGRTVSAIEPSMMKKNQLGQLDHSPSNSNSSLDKMEFSEKVERYKFLLERVSLFCFVLVFLLWFLFKVTVVFWLFDVYYQKIQRMYFCNIVDITNSEAMEMDLRLVKIVLQQPETSKASNKGSFRKLSVLGYLKLREKILFVFVRYSIIWIYIFNFTTKIFKEISCSLLYQKLACILLYWKIIKKRLSI